MRTAEDILYEQPTNGWAEGILGQSYYEIPEIKLAMIEFARMHCEAQAEAIKKTATTWYLPREEGSTKLIREENVSSAYPLTNIK